MKTIRSEPRAALSAATVVLISLWITSPALAVVAPHGGGHTPLGGKTVTVTAIPNPLPSPTGGGKATTGTIGTSPSARARPASTAAVGSRGGAGSSRAARSGASNGLGFQPDHAGQWEFWWAANRDGLLQRSEQSRQRSEVLTDGVGMLSGRGRSASSYADDAENLGHELLPVISAILRAEDDDLICDSGALALARLADETHAPFALPDLVSLLEHSTLSVRTSATLSLGVLPGRQATSTLMGLMADASTGRRAIGEDRVPWQVRSHAALALGLSGDPEAAASLLDLALHAAASDRDLRACAVTALGLIDEAAFDDRVTAGLLSLLEDRDEDAVVRAQIPVALARLGVQSTASRLVALLRHDKTDRFVRQSCAVALGTLTELDDKSRMKLLRDLATEATDDGLRHLAMIAVARVGAKADAADAKRHKDLVRFFVGELRRPSRKTDVGWTALAAGLYGRTQDAGRKDLAKALSKQFDDQKNPSTRAALALALGLLGAEGVAADLLSEFQERGDEEYRGHVALALGLLDHVDAADAFHEELGRASTSVTLRLQLVRSLSLMNAPGTADVLLGLLEASDSAAISWSVSRALGELRDPGSVDALVAIAEDTGRTELPRAFAVLALGLIGERSAVRWNVPVIEESNYLATVETLASLITL